jgi:surface antigen
MSIGKYERYWAVIDTYGRLVCLCVYRKGAEEVVRRLTGTMTIAGHQRSH